MADSTRKQGKCARVGESNGECDNTGTDTREVGENVEEVEKTNTSNSNEFKNADEGGPDSQGAEYGLRPNYYGLRPDSMFHNIKGIDLLEEGEYYDPIVFMNASDYTKELIRRGPFGGTSTKKKGFLTCSSEGRALATKRFWVRNIENDGTPQEYMEHLNKEIARGMERCQRNGEETLGESMAISGTVFSANECRTLGESEGLHCKNLETRMGEHTQQKEMGDMNDHIAKEIAKSNNETIQAIFKKTMAGSMREVIKDELQAWLGLKAQQSEIMERELIEVQEDVLEGSEAKECEEGDKGEEETPTNHGEDGDQIKEQMISPMRQMMNEEREAKRRTSSRQASKRQDRNYEKDTLTRATKRKECIEDTGMSDDIFSMFNVIPVHLLVHIASVCGLSVDIIEKDMVEIIMTAKARHSSESITLGF